MPNQAITSTGSPSANQDQTSPQASDTRALNRPLALSNASATGQAHRRNKGEFDIAKMQITMIRIMHQTVMAERICRVLPKGQTECRPCGLHSVALLPSPAALAGHQEGSVSLACRPQPRTAANAALKVALGRITLASFSTSGW